MQLHWGGALGVAHGAGPPTPPTPTDPAYDWSRYDASCSRPQTRASQVVFTIFGTPTWANGGRCRRARRSAAADLEGFAYAAAKRYSGAFMRDDGDTSAARPLLDGVERAEPADRARAAVEARRAAAG